MLSFVLFLNLFVQNIHNMQSINITNLKKEFTDIFTPRTKALVQRQYSKIVSQTTKLLKRFDKNPYQAIDNGLILIIKENLEKIKTALSSLENAINLTNNIIKHINYINDCIESVLDLNEAEILWKRMMPNPREK